MRRTTLLGVGVTINLWLLCTGCSPLNLQKYSNTPSGAFNSPEDEKLQKSCFVRIEKARQLAEHQHSLSSLWTLLFGIAAGISTAVAIVSATEPVRQRLGLAPVIIAVSVSALTAIATPIAVNRDKVGLVVSQYEVLSQQAEMADTEGKDGKARLYRLCSYGYAGFEVPPEPRE